MKIDLKWADSAPKTQFSVRFLQGMLNRVAVGFIRYGDFRTNGHDMKDHVRKALARYEKTGNTEFLIDVANYAMMEFVQPSITGAHLRHPIAIRHLVSPRSFTRKER